MRRCFDDYHTTMGRSVTMGDKGSIATAGVETVVLNVIVHGKTRKIKLHKVLLVPQFCPAGLGLGLTVSW